MRTQCSEFVEQRQQETHNKICVLFSQNSLIHQEYCIFFMSRSKGITLSLNDMRIAKLGRKVRSPPCGAEFEVRFEREATPP